jgi:hypothetical protein
MPKGVYTRTEEHCKALQIPHKKGQIPWNKGLVGIYIENKSWAWKGDKAKYSAIHTWVREQLGKPQECKICGNILAKKFEWINVNHKYQRNLDDYIRMCTSCHRKYDIKNNNYLVGFLK